MEPKKDILDYDLNSPDLEIFSDLVSSAKRANKTPWWQNLLNKTYIRTTLTLSLLLFLFGSTFFIASRVKGPSFKTSSADAGYIPEAQIDIPQLKKYKACSQINLSSDEISFLNSYCSGNFCNNNQERDTCEAVDVVVIENGFLSEETGQDAIADCTWTEDETCVPKY